MTDYIEALVKELEWEAGKTRKALSRIPDDKFDWKPHEKSRPVSSLSGHIAELPGWIPFVLQHEELDFNKPVTFLGHQFNNKKDLMEFFEKTLKDSKAVLEKAKDKELSKNWTIRKGDTILVKATKGEILRRMCFNHIAHHRAQLGVYLRLLNVPVPQTYGPSADEMGF